MARKVEEQADRSADADGQTDEQVPARQRSEEDDADEQEQDCTEGRGPGQDEGP